MRWPPTEIDWLARSPPRRLPAWPDAGDERVDIGRKSNQSKIVSAIQRQFVDRLVLDDCSDGCVFSLEKRAG